MEKIMDTSNLMAKIQIGSVKDRCPVHGDTMFRIPGGKIICERCARYEESDQVADVAPAPLYLPPRLARCSLDNYIPGCGASKKALDAVIEYLDTWPDIGGLIMLGRTGTGKTHLAAALCTALSLRRVKCEITTIYGLIRKVRATWGSRDADEDAITRRYCDVDFLVLDEIGSQYGSDAEKIIISEIINYRTEHDRPTAIVGNITVSEAKKSIGERAFDRIKDNGIIVAFTWQSHREFHK